MDNNLPGSFDKTITQIQRAATIYSAGNMQQNGRNVYRMAIHTTAQSDNIGELQNIEKFCENHGIFSSIAPLAPVGGGLKHSNLLLDGDQKEKAKRAGLNAIILSKTSKKEIGREVCGTCLYGLNIGFDGNLLFDAHAGYEVGSILGNIRNNSIKELIKKQREIAPKLFNNIDGFCPIRDPKWPAFLKAYLSSRT